MVFPVNQTRNSTWIATSALTRIGAVSVDNPASAEDLALALDRLDVIIQNLAGRGVCYLGDVDNTPAGLAEEIANTLANSLMPDFGNNAPPGSGAVPPQDIVDMRIRRINSDQISYGPQQATYY